MDNGGGDNGVLNLQEVKAFGRALSGNITKLAELDKENSAKLLGGPREVLIFFEKQAPQQKSQQKPCTHAHR